MLLESFLALYPLYKNLFVRKRSQSGNSLGLFFLYKEVSLCQEEKKVVNLMRFLGKQKLSGNFPVLFPRYEEESFCQVNNAVRNFSTTQSIL
jgi:hypothetical protein